MPLEAGFEGSSEKHANHKRVTVGFGMFVKPLTPGTLESFWRKSSNVGLNLKTGLSPRMEQERRRICHESF
jgi:hypothetical protein